MPLCSWSSEDRLPKVLEPLPSRDRLATTLESQRAQRRCGPCKDKSTTSNTTGLGEWQTNPTGLGEWQTSPTGLGDFELECIGITEIHPIRNEYAR